ncbi:band 4.1-like protein 4 isoform X8 [Sparus aurata]|uniref:band 4.1-like protein 4 isoform X8 n=1 Tax=Sparus aurata TaxID=8175 RepID=UPI0011C19C77|nr:band 4.1-like protein 4A isoform X8 [Sparus aurata]
MACFRGNREEFYGEVLLLDERKIILTAERGIKKSSKAVAILQQVFSHLRLSEVEFFGLKFCDNKQQTNWLDPSKSLSQHRDLIGPPYMFYFGVKFYAEDPSKLKEETTRYQFYLQVCQDVRRGRLPVPAHLRPRLAALMLLAEQEDHSKLKFDSEENQEIRHVYKTLRVRIKLSTSWVRLQWVWSSIRTKCWWGSISGRGSSNFTSKTRRLSSGSAERGIACSPTLALPRLNIAGLRIKSINNKTADVCIRAKHRTNQTSRVTSEPIMIQTEPPAFHRSEGGAEQDHVKPSAPWENSGSLNGLFNLKFPNTEEEEDEKGGRPQRRSRSLDGDRPMRQRGRRSRSHGNTSSGSESEKTASHSSRCRRRTKKRSDSTCRCRARSRSPGALAWKHIQKQLVEPDGLMERQTEEIPYKEVRVSEQIRMHRSPRGRRHHRWASATDLDSKIELVPPLPVTKATDTSCNKPHICEAAATSLPTIHCSQ